MPSACAYLGKLFAYVHLLTCHHLDQNTMCSASLNLIIVPAAELLSFQWNVLRVLAH